MMYQSIFKRYEKKYILNKTQYEGLMNALSYNAIPDEYGESAVCNIYYDTPDWRLIRRSLEKPVYKEKLRLRCYGIPDNDTRCFVELKKKYKGVVYKRRTDARYRAGFGYLAGEEYNLPDGQIAREIDSFMSFYGDIRPAMAIFYDRSAYISRDDEGLRFTFDRNISARKSELDLRLGAYGEGLLPDGQVLLEIKTASAFPLWLTGVLSELQIYPASFSKYGTAYTQLVLKPMLNKESNTKIIKFEGGVHCA